MMTIMMIEYKCLHEQQWCVCLWVNPIQSLVKPVRHYISAATMASVYLSDAQG